MGNRTEEVVLPLSFQSNSVITRVNHNEKTKLTVFVRNVFHLHKNIDENPWSL